MLWVVEATGKSVKLTWAASHRQHSCQLTPIAQTERAMQIIEVVMVVVTMVKLSSGASVLGGKYGGLS